MGQSAYHGFSGHEVATHHCNYCCVYHGITVCKVNPSTGKVKLNTGGWHTATTKQRMNQFAAEYCDHRFQVFQKNFEWFVSTEGGEVPFVDGMEV